MTNGYIIDHNHTTSKPLKPSLTVGLNLSGNVVRLRLMRFGFYGLFQRTPTGENHKLTPYQCL